MTNETQIKKRESALKGITVAGIAGAVTGGLLGAIDGLFESEIFSNPAFPINAGIGVGIVASKPSKELGVFQGAADVSSVIGGYYIGYPITKSLIKYLKQ